MSTSRRRSRHSARPPPDLSYPELRDGIVVLLEGAAEAHRGDRCSLRARAARRYKKKVEKEDDYIRQIKGLANAIETDIKQNYSIDIYQEYYEGETTEDYSSEPPSAKTLAVFRDPSESKRSACSISWHPDAGRKLAVAFAIMQFQDYRQQGTNMDSYIWDVNNPNTPEISLTPPSPLCCLEYNPKDPHLLVGGSYNGLVTCYDTRVGYSPKEASIIEKSHRNISPTPP